MALELLKNHGWREGSNVADSQALASAAGTTLREVLHMGQREQEYFRENSLFIAHDTIRSYIAYVREKSHPEWSEDASRRLRELSGKGTNAIMQVKDESRRSNVPVVDILSKLSFAAAKIWMKEQVEEQDVEVSCS